MRWRGGGCGQVAWWRGGVVAWWRGGVVGRRRGGPSVVGVYGVLGPPGLGIVHRIPPLAAGCRPYQCLGVWWLVWWLVSEE